MPDPSPPPSSPSPRGLWRVVDRALPPALHGAPADERLRARFILLFCASYVLLGVAVAVIRAASPDATGAELAAFAAGIFLFPLSSAALVWRGSTRRASIVLLVGAALTLLVGVARTGGLGSPSAAWVVTIPFASGFFLGRGSALPAALAALAVVGLLALGHAIGVLPAFPGTGLAYHTATLGGLLAFTALVARLHEWSAARARAAEEDAAALADLIAAQAGTGAVVVVEGTVRWVNDAALTLLGRTRADTRGRRWDTVVPPIAHPLPNGRPNRVELDDAFPGGARHIELRNEPVFTARGPRLLVTLTDQTERVAAARARLRMEARLAESERLESLGRIAGGVAHDFNNLLVGIMCNAELLGHSAQLSPDDRLSLADIRTASERAASLVTQLLAYAGRGHAALRPLDAVSATREAIQLAEAARRTPRVITLHAPPEATVLADPALLSQVCTNLLTNAIDACGPHAEVGSVRVRIDTVDATPAQLSHSLLPGLPPAAGTYVRIAITDNGPGIPDDVRQRLFEPFYTTKANGSGLGLPAVQGILKRLGGALLLHAPPGTGATFIALLPPGTAAPAEEGPSVERATSAQPGRLHALVVDDDPLVRSQIARVLTRASIAVTETDSGPAALARLDSGLATYDLVLIDFLMPGMDGVELARHLHRHHPRLPLVLCSGTVADADVPDGLFAAVIAKPFAPAALVDAVTRAARPA